MDCFLYNRDLRHERIKLTVSLESTVQEIMSTISVSRKLDVPIEENAVNQKVFPFLSVLLKLQYNIQKCYFCGSASSNSKETLIDK